jgi:hypothetical protein
MFSQKRKRFNLDKRAYKGNQEEVFTMATPKPAAKPTPAKPASAPAKPVKK